MSTKGRVSALCAALTVAISTAPEANPIGDDQSIEHGRYLAVTSGCNDCHTPGYAEAGGKASPDVWLTGSSVGFQGPWGTTYPVNLRLYVQSHSENDWIRRMREPIRPPMPWFNLREMTDADLVALYRYLRDLGPAGSPTPAAAPPGVMVATPYIEFTPKNISNATSNP